MGTSLREVKKLQTRRAIRDRALELFSAEGYDSVTMTAIAAAAQVGERTVYRYFGDKEEILFADDDQIHAVLRAAIETQPADADPTVIMRATAHAVAELASQQKAELRNRAAVVEATPALYARERVKQAGHQQLISTYLAARGVGVERARLLGSIGVACFNEGLTRWLGAPGDGSLVDEIDAVFAELRELIP